MTELLKQLSSTGWRAVNAFADFCVYLYTTSVFDFVETITKNEIFGPFFGWIFDKNLEILLDLLGIGDMSVLMFIAVDGLLLIAVLQFIKWILSFFL